MDNSGYLSILAMTSLLYYQRYACLQEQTMARSKLTFSKILDSLPKDVDSRSIVVSNKPAGGQDRLLSSLKGVAFQNVGLQYDEVAPLLLFRILT